MTTIICPECLNKVTLNTLKCKQCGLASMYCDLFITNGNTQILIDDFIKHLVQNNLQHFNFTYDDALQAIKNNPEQLLSENKIFADYADFVHKCEDIREMGLKGKLNSSGIIACANRIVDDHLEDKSTDFLKQWFGFFENERRKDEHIPD